MLKDSNPFQHLENLILRLQAWIRSEYASNLLFTRLCKGHTFLNGKVWRLLMLLFTYIKLFWLWYNLGKVFLQSFMSSQMALLMHDGTLTHWDMDALNWKMQMAYCSYSVEIKKTILHIPTWHTYFHET